MTETITLENQDELSRLIAIVMKRLREQTEIEGAQILALHGDLGAGKTTFMQALALELGVTETVTSPTFVVMKNYKLEDQAWETLTHIDAYRIEEIDEMRPLGFSELLTKKDTIVCIEWAEKIAELLPPHTLHLTFVIDGETRVINIDA